MHGISVHSALAIKRQRKRREQYVKKYKSKHKRRQESQIEEDPTGPDEPETDENSAKNIGTITSFHIGLIFLFISVLLLLSSLITLYNQNNAGQIDWKEVTELLGTCVICLIIGVFLLVIHRIYNKSEEEKLNKYINKRLCKSKSGNIIYKENSRDAVNEV